MIISTEEHNFFMKLLKKTIDEFKRKKKPVNLTVFCTKCIFEVDWDDCPSKRYALQYYKKWNKEHKKNMTCIHDYEVEIRK